MTALTNAQIDYLASQRLGRVATTGTDGKPHVVPTSFRYNHELGTIDIGGHHVATTKKYRDVQANAWAAIVVDDLVSIDPWSPRMLEIRGRVRRPSKPVAPTWVRDSEMPSSASLLRRSTASASSDRRGAGQSDSRSASSSVVMIQA